MCVAVDVNGNALHYDGVSWSSRQRISAYGLKDVSCPTPTFCVAVSKSGYAVTGY